MFRDKADTNQLQVFSPEAKHTSAPAATSDYRMANTSRGINALQHGAWSKEHGAWSMEPHMARLRWRDGAPAATPKYARGVESEEVAVAASELRSRCLMSDNRCIGAHSHLQAAVYKQTLNERPGARGLEPV
jgi:hypothetical protein